jgi:hypothetical protein
MDTIQTIIIADLMTDLEARLSAPGLHSHEIDALLALRKQVQDVQDGSKTAPSVIACLSPSEDQAELPDRARALVQTGMATLEHFCRIDRVQANWESPNVKATISALGRATITQGRVKSLRDEAVDRVLKDLTTPA